MAEVWRLNLTPGASTWLPGIPTTDGFLSQGIGSPDTADPLYPEFFELEAWKYHATAGPGGTPALVVDPSYGGEAPTHWDNCGLWVSDIGSIPSSGTTFPGNVWNATQGRWRARFFFDDAVKTAMVDRFCFLTAFMLVASDDRDELSFTNVVGHLQIYDYDEGTNFQATMRTVYNSSVESSTIPYTTFLDKWVEYDVAWQCSLTSTGYCTAQYRTSPDGVTWSAYVPLCSATGINFGNGPAVYRSGATVYGMTIYVGDSGLEGAPGNCSYAVLWDSDEEPPVDPPIDPEEPEPLPEPELPETNTRSFSLHDPISASPNLEAHGGRKEGRLITIGSIIRRSTDRLGGWQSSTCRWSSDDHDRLLRGLQRTNRWYGREFRVYIGDRLDLANSRCLGRFNIRSYPPTPGFGVDVEGTDVIGSEFSAFNLDRDILDGYVFDGTRFPQAPEELLSQVPPQPVPAYWGRWSDESSSGEPPVFEGVTRRGSWIADIHSHYRVGFAEMALVNPGGVSPLPPDSVAGSCIAGGSIDLGQTPYNALFGQVWAETDGVEGDPEPFYPELFPIAITLNDSKIRITWTFAGVNPDHWRIGLAVSYFGARWSQVMEVAGSARAVEFTSLSWAGVGVDTPGATQPYWNRKDFAVTANMPDGQTGASNPIAQHPYAGPYQRPAYVSWIPIPDAVSYNLYFAEVGYAYFGWKRMVVVGADQIDADGYVYYVYNWGADGEAVEGIIQPRGMIPVIDTGDVTFAGGTYGQLVIGRYPMHQIISVFAGEKRLADNHADLRHQDHPSWVYPTPYVTIGGHDTTVLYVRTGSAVLTEHRDGTALIRVNACTTEDIGDGTGSTITQAARVVQHMLTELVFNDHTTGVWEGIPLYGDGVPVIRSSSFAAAETMQIARIGGTGYTARVALTQSTILRTLITDVVQSFGLHLGINQHGQVVCGHYDDSVDPTVGYPHYKDIREIVGNIAIEPRTQELENEIPYQWDWRPETNTYHIVNQLVTDETSIADYLGKPRTGQLRSLPYAADQSTVDDVMQRLLLLGAYVREWVSVPISIVGFNNDVDLFKIVAITDEEGTGATGYHEEFLLILEIEVIPPDPANDQAVVVVLSGLNITALADAAWVWGPDSITDWDTMTVDEQGTYGAWADEDNLIPTANDPAKEWR